MSAVSLPALRQEFSQFELALEQDSARNKKWRSCIHMTAIRNN